MSGRKTPTREKILETLSRRGPCTAAEMARRFRLTSMAVRQHLAVLGREGFVCTGAERRSRGRPARTWSLTPAGRRSFPDRSGALALEILLEVEATAGRDAVVQALERRGRRTAEVYRAAVQGRTVAEGLRVLARLRDGEGYLCDAGSEPEKNGSAREIVERHCPVSAVAARYPEVCRIEKEVFSRALGVPVVRVEHMLSGDRCCRYRVNGGPDAPDASDTEV